MKIKIPFQILLLLLLTGCHNSTVGNQAKTVLEPEVAYNPTVSANLKVLHFRAHHARLIDHFRLDPNTSTAVAYLEANQQIFDTTLYSSLYATSVFNLYSLACREVADDTVLFPDGPTIDNIWFQFTGESPDTDAKQLEADLLEQTDGQPNDVKNFALCMGTSTDAKATFNNFQTEKE